MTIEELKEARRAALHARDLFRHRLLTVIEERLVTLADNARTLAERLQRVAADLEQRGTNASFNSLGEVQGHGSGIDRLCGELRLALDLLAELGPEGGRP